MESTFGQRFGALIARKREDQGWTFAQLALEAYGDDGAGGDKRKADVQKLEAGNSRKPNAATIRKYRLALDLTQDEIDACRTPEEIELANFARALFDVIAEGAKAAGLTEDLALAVADHYAENNHGNFEGALASLKDALADAAKEQERDAAGSNYQSAADDFIKNTNARNRAGEIDEAYADLKIESARRAEAREERLAEDIRIQDLLITQAALANDADGYAQAHLQRIKLDSPSPEDTFGRLRDLFKERYFEGLRLGTPFALTSAAGLARSCIGIAPTPYLRAMAQSDHAIALQDQGSRTEGPEGVALLSKAVETHRAALNFYTEADYPLLWATTMQNLAISLETQGDRTDGSEGNSLLEEAVNIYRAALRVRTEIEQPAKWALTMQNLAGALESQGNRTTGKKGSALLTQAVDCYKAALRFFTETDEPIYWAAAMQNLAGVIRYQSVLSKDAAGKTLLAEAIETYSSDLRVRTKADYPMDWAITHENLAIVELSCAAHESTLDPRPHLTAALAHVDNALRVYDPDHLSYRYTQAIALRAMILAALASLSS